MARVDFRWETRMTVRSSPSSLRAFSTTPSLRLSKLLVGSSRSSRGASCKKARAKPMRWRSPQPACPLETGREIVQNFLLTIGKGEV